MNKLPTSNISAYTYWLLGNEEEIKIINRNMSSNYNAALDRAEELYYLALEHDSTYSKAYAGLASVYWNKYHDKEYYTETFLDSAVVLIDKALSYDEDLASAHKLKGDYYYRTGKPDEALKEYDRALELNPNDWQIYMGLGRIYLGDDLTKELMNYHKAAALNQGKGLSEILRSISSVYRDAGFNAKSRYYLEQLLTLKGDSIQYLIGLSGILYYEREYERSIELYKKAFRKDTNNIDLLIRLGEISLEIGNYEEALVAYEKYVNSRENFRSVEGHNSHRIAHAYWVNGNQEKANYYFDKQLEYCQADIALGRSWGNLYYPYYDIAGIYAFRGEYERAFENLRMFSQKERHPLWMVDVIRIDPLFNSIRDEPEFQQIVRDVEAKYQAEHEKVRKWLEENDR